MTGCSPWTLVCVCACLFSSAVGALALNTSSSERVLMGVHTMHTDIEHDSNIQLDVVSDVLYLLSDFISRIL
jgi:hypothetical protein